MRIVICGAGIAGGTLAHWLLRGGHSPLLVERAPAPRTGGYVMDFWGAGYTVAERMGILPAVRAAGYAVRAVRLVDAAGRKAGGFAVDSLRNLTQGRLTSVQRGVLADAVLAAAPVETVFGDSIAAIEEHARGVRVTLDSGRSEQADLVVGADGLHSRVRQLAFGAVEETDLGYRVAVFEAAGYRPRDALAYVVHAAPSRQIGRFAMRGDRTLFLLVFRAALMDGVEPDDDAGVRAMLRRVFGSMRWEAPAILAAMDAAGEIYYDRVSQIRMEAWHRGRVALVGDAGMAVSLLAGEGAGLAMTEAYVLAGELAQCGGAHEAAFAAYAARLRPFVAAKQRSATKFAASFVPRTAFGIWLRNQATRLMALPGVATLLLGRAVRDDFALPDYAWTVQQTRT
jgi:2-polyprenyl-6-methoxyphenol hydroxylase-like FAD-dependent oxidoreductase